MNNQLIKAFHTTSKSIMPKSSQTMCDIILLPKMRFQTKHRQLTSGKNCFVWVHKAQKDVAGLALAPQQPHSTTVQQT